jgi:hypothetical protein
VLFLLIFQYAGAYALTNFSGFSEFLLSAGPDPYGFPHLPKGQTATDFKLDAAIYSDFQMDIADIIFFKFAASAYGQDLFPMGTVDKKYQTYQPEVKNSSDPYLVGGKYPLVNDRVEFSIEEISATGHIRTSVGQFYVSAFLGGFETPGTDVYMQKYFGINHLSSLVMQKRLIANGLTMYPIEGIGGSVTWRLNEPIAISLYGSVPTNSDDKTRTMSFDLRVAGSYPHALFDVTFGASIAPATKVQKEVLADPLIGQEYQAELPAQAGGLGLINFSANTVFGNLYRTNFHVQLGVNGFDINYKPTKKRTMGFDLDIVYAVIEPRIAFGGLKLTLTGFVLPKLTTGQYGTPYSDLTFIADDVGLGGAFSAYYDQLYIGDVQTKLGLAIAGGMKTHLGTLLEDPPKILPYSATIGLFWSLNLYNGVFNILAKGDPLNQTTYPTRTADKPRATATSPKPDFLQTLKFQISYLSRF